MLKNNNYLNLNLLIKNKITKIKRLFKINYLNNNKKKMKKILNTILILKKKTIKINKFKIILINKIT